MRRWERAGIWEPEAGREARRKEAHTAAERGRIDEEESGADPKGERVFNRVQEGLKRRAQGETPAWAPPRPGARAEGQTSGEASPPSGAEEETGDPDLARKRAAPGADAQARSKEAGRVRGGGQGEEASSPRPEERDGSKPGRRRQTGRDPAEERGSALLFQLERLERAQSIPLERTLPERLERVVSRTVEQALLGRRASVPGWETFSGQTASPDGWETFPGERAPLSVQEGLFRAGEGPGGWTQRREGLPGLSLPHGEGAELPQAAGVQRTPRPGESGFDLSRADGPQWAEEADRVFRRDSRRYDRGFYLY